MINTKEPKDTKDASVDLMLKYFEVLCQSHDWNYAFTDDASVWRRGDKERQEITRVARELSELGFNREADEILKAHMY